MKISLKDNPELDKNKITRKFANSCNCGSITIAYKLPKKISKEIVPLIHKLGKPAFDFNKTSLLKVENNDFSITAINRLKDIKITLKKKSAIIYLDEFESIILEYVKA